MQCMVPGRTSMSTKSTCSSWLSSSHRLDGTELVRPGGDRNSYSGVRGSPRGDVHDVGRGRDPLRAARLGPAAVRVPGRAEQHLRHVDPRPRAARRLVHPGLPRLPRQRALGSAPAETYRFDRLADDLDELRGHLGFESVSVLAHSMGGFVALHYALRHPERARRLALVGTSPCGGRGPMAIPVLRALGPMRTAKALAHGGTLRRPVELAAAQPGAHGAMYAPMSVTQEARPELRAKVARPTPSYPSTTTSRRT